MQKMTKQCNIKISLHFIRQKYDAIKNGALILTGIPQYVTTAKTDSVRGCKDVQRIPEHIFYVKMKQCGTIKYARGNGVIGELDILSKL